MATWAVLVVHGVGDTGPGVTVDNFLWSLVDSGAQLRPSGVREVQWFAEPAPGTPAPGLVAPPPVPTTVSATCTMFPVHVRRAQVIAPPAGGPSDAVFAEVYWADLSRVREGTLNLVYGLVSTIFFLRFIPDWAAYLDSKLARWVRYLLHGASWLLCSPIAALHALLAFMIAGYFWVLAPLTADNAPVMPGTGMATDPSLGPERIRMGTLSLFAAVASLAAALWSRGANAGSTWTRFWYATAVIAAVLTLVIVLVPPTYWDPFLDMVQRKLAPDEAGAFDGPGRYPAAVLFGLLYGIWLAFCLLWAYLLLVAVPAWALAWKRESGRWNARPALGVALGATLAQITLWVLIMLPLAILAARNLLPRQRRMSVEAFFFPAVKVSLTVHLLEALLLAGIALLVWWRRRRWVQTKARGYAYPPGPDIPRLVVNALLVIIVILLFFIFSGFTLYEFAFPDAFPAPWAAEGVTALVLGVITLGGALLASGIRDSLHILMDIINHFYRRWEAIPYPWLPLAPVDVSEFETQQLIEHRFRRALSVLLADPTVTHLSVVAHSQGTIIAVDVLSLSGLSPVDQAALKARLKELTEFHLITMGSPLTHLYQHYFPERYSSLANAAWTDLRCIVRRWVNLFRADDFIGTDIETVSGWAGSPVNDHVGVGGHSGYWRQREVHQHLLLQPGLPPAVHASLGTPSLPG